VIHIFLLLGFVITLGIDDDYDVCRCLKCLWSKNRKDIIGKKDGVHHIGLRYWHSSFLQAISGSH